jgi:hypothetical protein
MLEAFFLALFGIPTEHEFRNPNLQRAEISVHSSRTRNFVQYAEIKINNDKQFKCFDELMHRESSWRTRKNPELADNPRSSAYGIPQALPGEKMASAGHDWATNPITQIRWALQYIEDRYSTPCEALEFHDRKGWY